MKNQHLLWMAVFSIWIVSGNLNQSAAEEVQKPCGGKSVEKQTILGDGPWICPLFVLYDYGGGEYLYYAEYREEDCFDEPQGALLFGNYILPGDCPDGCLPGFLQKQEKQKQKESPTYLTMDKGVKPDYLLARPAVEQTFSYSDERLKFIQFEGAQFGFDRKIVARVNLIEVYTKDSRLPRGRQTLQYCAWETDGSALPDGEEPITVTNIGIEKVTDSSGETSGLLFKVHMEYPGSNQKLTIPLLIADEK